jgi:hypothetical protein
MGKINNERRIGSKKHVDRKKSYKFFCAFLFFQRNVPSFADGYTCNPLFVKFRILLRIGGAKRWIQLRICLNNLFRMGFIKS